MKSSVFAAKLLIFSVSGSAFAGTEVKTVKADLYCSKPIQKVFAQQGQAFIEGAILDSGFEEVVLVKRAPGVYTIYEATKSRSANDDLQKVSQLVESFEGVRQIENKMFVQSAISALVEKGEDVTDYGMAREWALYTNGRGLLAISEKNLGKPINMMWKESAQARSSFMTEMTCQSNVEFSFHE